MAMSAESTKGIKLYFILLQNHLEVSGNIPLLFAFQVFDPLEKPHPLSGGLTTLLTQQYKKVYLNWRLVLKIPNKVLPPCLVVFPVLDLQPQYGQLEVSGIQEETSFSFPHL